MDRREFIQRVSILAGAFALPAACGDNQVPSGKPDAGGADFNLPTLGGAPNTHTGRVIAAFCDTIIPGAYRDPLQKPGPIDVGACGLFFDPTLPAAQYVSILVTALDGFSRSMYKGKQFDEISPDDRDAVVAAAEASEDLMEFAIQLAKLAFYSSDGAGAYLGYPGPNTGYWADADFTFGIPLATEMTKNGNPD
jgi:hypothetical protein